MRSARLDVAVHAAASMHSQHGVGVEARIRARIPLHGHDGHNRERSTQESPRRAAHSVAHTGAHHSRSDGERQESSQ